MRPGPTSPPTPASSRVGGVDIAVRDAVVAATDGEALALGADIPVRKGTEGWAFLVAHLVDDGAAIAEGDEVVDRGGCRDAPTPSRSATRPATRHPSPSTTRSPTRWSKPARDDALGNPDFDGIAIASSRIEPDGSVDRYRLNKSLRRAGFDIAGARSDDLDGARRSRRRDQLDEWVAAGATVRVERDGDGAHRPALAGSPSCPTARRASPAAAPTSTSLAELAAIAVSFSSSTTRAPPCSRCAPRRDSRR